MGGWGQTSYGRVTEVVFFTYTSPMARGPLRDGEVWGA
jgi:hypothetical protein